MTEQSFRLVPAETAREGTMKVWSPLLVPREAIEAEIERLSEVPAGQGGRRSSVIVHPESTAPGLGLSPGVDVTINVLKPGEETEPVRHNSNQVEFCLRGEGVVRAGDRQISVSKWSAWNIPSMKVYSHRNVGKDLFVRLTYSNAPLLEKLGIHHIERGVSHSDLREGASAASASAPAKYTRENAPDFVITEAGARVRGYEFLTDIEVLENHMIHWPWEKVSEHLSMTYGDNKRNIMLLYNPATERRNGTTHAFFATLSSTPSGTPPRKRGRGHKHSSVAINYHYKGYGSSIVDGQEFHWRAGDLMLSAPSWSEHAHFPGPEGHGILTIQDHPLQIGMESLIWQERLDGPILTLGSEKGQTGYVGPRQAGA
jgi:gentisate 1,2-dioxygenase